MSGGHVGAYFGVRGRWMSVGRSSIGRVEAGMANDTFLKIRSF
jgi:hypothetical protein